MAIKFNRSQTFATNGTVTAAALHNLIDGTDIYQALITDQTAMTSVGSLDKLLIADSDLTAGDAPRSVTVNELFEDALTLSTYTNIKATNAAITTGTIATGTFGTTTSTAATITTGTITTGVIPTGTFGTTTSTAATITTGTIPALTSITKITSGTGTAAAPAISPTGDTNTGIFFPLADTVAFSEGGTEAMRIDSNGNVGIGVTSPIVKLDVYGDGSFQNLEIGKGGQTGNRNALIDLAGDETYTDYGLRILRGNTGADASSSIANRGSGSLSIIGGQGAGEAGKVLILTRNTERLRIEADGQIGIGGANYGTSGQVLTSGGSAAAPSWSNATIGTNSVTFPTLSTSTTEADNAASRVARAWVNFNGTGTVSTRASFNVSSITDIGTGDYAVNFTTAMSDANYVVVVGGRRSTGASFDQNIGGYALSSSSASIRTADEAPSAADFEFISVAIFR
jgi:hypothetical protein